MNHFGHTQDNQSTKVDISVTGDISLKDAMKVLDHTRQSLLVIVDENSALLGCLSDGDVRRAILMDNDLTSSISAVYNRAPVFIHSHQYTDAYAEQLMIDNKINVLPIVDDAKHFVGYVTRDELFVKSGRRIPRKQLNVPVVLMAGGKGTRLDPLTRVLPKPLLPVGEKPIIEIIIERFGEYGIHEYYITVSHKSRIIKAYFEEIKHDYSVQFLDETSPLGTAGGLCMLKDKVQGSFFVSNSDIIIDTDYAELFHFHETHEYDLTLVASLKHFNIPYGVCELQSGGDLLEIREKPEYSFLVNTGLYLIKHSALSLIPEDTFFHVTDLIRSIQAKGGKIGVFPVGEQSWADIGVWAEYKKTLHMFDQLA